jgi:hypothetical protein
MIDIVFYHLMIGKVSEIRGATRYRYWATPSHSQPPSTQLDTTSGDAKQPEATGEGCRYRIPAQSAP